MSCFQTISQMRMLVDKSKKVGPNMPFMYVRLRKHFLFNIFIYQKFKNRK